VECGSANSPGFSSAVSENEKERQIKKEKRKERTPLSKQT